MNVCSAPFRLLRWDRYAGRYERPAGRGERASRRVGLGMRWWWWWWRRRLTKVVLEKSGQRRDRSRKHGRLCRCGRRRWWWWCWGRHGGRFVCQGRRHRETGMSGVIERVREVLVEPCESVSSFFCRLVHGKRRQCVSSVRDGSVVSPNNAGASVHGYTWSCLALGL